MTLFTLPAPSTTSQFFEPRGKTVVRPIGLAESIIGASCRKFGITLAELTGKGRWRVYVQARHYAINRLRVECGLSSSAIGELLNKNHTTILHHLGRLKNSKPPLQLDARAQSTDNAQGGAG